MNMDRRSSAMVGRALVAVWPVALLGVLALACAVQPASGATVSNATPLADSFQVPGRVDTLSGPAGVYVRQGSVTALIDQHLAGSGYQLAVTGAGYLPPAETLGRVTYTLPEGSNAVVGTVFSFRSIGATYGVSPFNVSVSGAGSILSLAGSNDAVGRIEIATLPRALTCTQMVHNLQMVAVSGYSENGEIYGESPRGWLTIPERLAPIPVAVEGVTASVGPSWGGPLTKLVDLNADGTYAMDGGVSTGPWWPADTHPEIALDLGAAGENDEFDVAGLLLVNRGDYPADIDILSGDGTTWSSSPICHVANSASSEFLVVKFSAPVHTSHLKLQQTGNGGVLLFKAIPLRAISAPRATEIKGY